MKNTLSLKTCLMALCFFAAQEMSANAAISKELFTRSNILEKITAAELSEFIKTPTGIATAAFAISVLIFNMREPDGKPNRYNLEELKANPSFKNIFKFVYYFLLDGVIGNKRQSSSAKIGDDGKTVVLKQGYPARGFYGQVSELIKPISETLGFIPATGKFISDCVFGLIAWELLLKMEHRAPASQL